MLKSFFFPRCSWPVVLPHCKSLSFKARFPSPHYSVTVFVTRWYWLTNSEGLITNQYLLSVFTSLFFLLNPDFSHIKSTNLPLPLVLPLSSLFLNFHSFWTYFMGLSYILPQFHILNHHCFRYYQLRPNIGKTEYFPSDRLVVEEITQLLYYLGYFWLEVTENSDWPEQLR